MSVITMNNPSSLKVKLDAGERKGKIIIQYNSNDDLERILSLLK